MIFKLYYKQIKSQLIKDEQIMYDIERQKKILEILSDNKPYSVYKLAEMLYASGATIRRDLTKMEQKGLVTRTFGAVMLNPYPTNKEISFELREKANITEKRALCTKAAECLKDNISIFVDSSSTLLHLVPFLNSYNNITIITNGLFLAQEVITHTKCNLYLCGGNVQANTNSILGPIALNSIQNFHADLLFMSCGGFDFDFGFSEYTVDSAELKKRMILNSEKVILICDHSKLHKKVLFNTCNLKDIDVLITNAEFTDNEKELIKEANVTLIQ